MKFSLLVAAFALIAAFPLTAKAFDNEKIPELKKTETMVKAEAMVKADAMVEAVTETPAIKAVVFYSDSCGSCKILDPRMKAALNAINPAEIEVVKFDFSNKETIEATKVLAATAGVENILQEYGAKTGFIVLVNEAGEVVEKLTKQDETADIAGKLAMSIAKNS